VNVTSDVTLSPVPHARNLGVLFYSNLSLPRNITSITKFFSHITDPRRIRPILDHTTARNIAITFVRSKLDNCNFIFLNLPANQVIVFSLFLIMLLVQSLKPPDFIT
jgi:hypothetical protein